MSVIIIAEAGVNHNGDYNIAKQLIIESKKMGADIVKFQMFDADKLASSRAKMAEYQRKNLGVEMSQKDMLSRLMLQPDDFVRLAHFCDELGIGFLTTPFDIGSIHFLNKLQKMWKIPSGEITNYPYLVEIAKTGKDVIMSTGMSTLKEVDEAVEVLRENRAGSITLLHCTTSYPACLEDVNLKAMITLKEHFGCAVGYSDHTVGIDVAIASVAMGAQVIEKHLTLDRNMNGPDHKASLEPREFADMIRGIRNVEKALGDGSKSPARVEISNIEVARKSIVAAQNIKKGDILTETNLTTKRPGTGISPMKWREIIGTKAIKDFYKDDLIEANL